MKFALLFTCLLLHQLLSAQPAPVRNLVFEGAGIRGIAYSGAIRMLEEKDLLRHVHRIGGTSAGAITALALCLGYKSDEITRLISSTAFHKFNDGAFFFMGGIYRLRKYYGWYRGQQFRNWLEDLIEKKTGNSEFTFSQLHQAEYKDLYVTGTSLNGQKLIVFSHETFPEMKLKDAVRISMSIPLYFQPVAIDAAGSVVKKLEPGSPGHIMVDGGITGNFPIRLFDSTKYGTPAEQNRFLYNKETVGFRIDSDQQIANDQVSQGLREMPVTDLKEYFTAFYTLVLESLNRQQLSKEDWQRTVSISDGAVGPRIRKLTQKEISTLVENGYAAARLYLDK